MDRKVDRCGYKVDINWLFSIRNHLEVDIMDIYPLGYIHISINDPSF